MKAEDIVKLTVGQAQAFIDILHPLYDEYQYKFIHAPRRSKEELDFYEKQNEISVIIYGLEILVGVRDYLIRSREGRDWNGMQLVYDTRILLLRENDGR